MRKIITDEKAFEAYHESVERLRNQGYTYKEIGVLDIRDQDGEQLALMYVQGVD